jgi:UDP-glucose 4-epimerase
VKEERERPPIRIFLTGATGFIGNRMIEICTERYGPDSITASFPPPRDDVERERAERIRKQHVKTLVWDLLEPFPPGAVIPSFDAVVHLAAFTTTEIESEEIRVNDEGTRNLIDVLSSKLPHRPFLFTSTQMAVDKPDPDTWLVDEETPCRPRTEYGRTKLRAEAIVRERSREIGFPHIILRPPTVYGPGFRNEGMFGLFARWAARSFSLADIDWTGVMSLLYLDDMVTVMIRLLESNDPRTRNDTFFLSSPERTTMGEIVRGIAEANGETVRAIRIPKWMETIVEKVVWQDRLWRLGPHIVHIMAWRLSLIIGRGYYGDPARFQEVLPDFTYVPFREGVRRTYGVE